MSYDDNMTILQAPIPLLGAQWSSCNLRKEANPRLWSSFTEGKVSTEGKDKATNA